jgi:cell division protein ZipA
LLVAPEGEHFDGVQLWDALTSLGLRWGDGDYFHWESPHAVGDDHVFSVGTTTEPGYFLPELATSGRLQVADLAFGFMPMRAHDPLEVLDAMLRGARYVQRRLGGEIRGADGSPLDEHAIRHAIEQLVRDMERAGVAPGSHTALRLL